MNAQLITLYTINIVIEKQCKTVNTSHCFFVQFITTIKNYHFIDWLQSLLWHTCEIINFYDETYFLWHVSYNWLDFLSFVHCSVRFTSVHFRLGKWFITGFILSNFTYDISCFTIFSSLSFSCSGLLHSLFQTGAVIDVWRCL